MLVSDPHEIHLPEGLSEKLGRKLKLPPSFTPGAGAQDPVNMFVTEVPNDSMRLDGVTVGLIYVDAKGDSSTRLVSLKQLWRGDVSSYVTGYCYLRSAMRQFRIDRIQSVVDPETGEILCSGDEYFDRLSSASQNPLRLSVWDEVKDGLRILSAFATVDDRLYKNEVLTIIHYAKTRAGKHGYEFDSVELKTIERIIKSLRPTAECAKEALWRVRKSKDHAVDILNSIKATCLADGKLNNEEIELIGLLDIKIIPYARQPEPSSSISKPNI